MSCTYLTPSLINSMCWSSQWSEPDWISRIYILNTFPHKLYVLVIPVLRTRLNILYILNTFPHKLYVLFMSMLRTRLNILYILNTFPHRLYVLVIPVLRTRLNVSNILITFPNKLCALVRPVFKSVSMFSSSRFNTAFVQIKVLVNVSISCFIAQ